MQDWIDQANKNDLKTQEFGKCQLCSSNTSHGISECVEIASQVTHKFDHMNGIKYMTIFLCVDAHALQHSEIHGRWNNHFHLTRLNLILQEELKWSYQFSSLLSAVVDSYKIGREHELIVPPRIGDRGQLTVTDVSDKTTDTEYTRVVWDWASQVYNSYENGHEFAREISRLFMKKLAKH